MDFGQSVMKSRGCAATTRLADTVQGMMAKWTEEQFPNFMETMELIRDRAPVKYAQLYMEAVKMGIVKETNINVNFNMQKDRESLQALVRTRLPLTDSGTYTPYEEVKPKKLPIKEEL